MTIKPPPIREPWKLDQTGRLVSPAWVLWLQDLVNAAQAEDMFSDSLTLQTTISSSSEDPQASSESSTEIQMLQPQSTSSIISDDALLFSWLSF